MGLVRRLLIWMVVCFASVPTAAKAVSCADSVTNAQLQGVQDWFTENVAIFHTNTVIPLPAIKGESRVWFVAYGDVFGIYTRHTLHLRNDTFQSYLCALVVPHEVIHYLQEMFSLSASMSCLEIEEQAYQLTVLWARAHRIRYSYSQAKLKAKAEVCNLSLKRNMDQISTEIERLISP